MPVESFYGWALKPYLRPVPGTGISAFSSTSSQVSTGSVLDDAWQRSLRLRREKAAALADGYCEHPEVVAEPPHNSLAR